MLKMCLFVDEESWANELGCKLSGGSVFVTHLVL